MSFKCSICGNEVDFKDVIYVKGNVIVCRKCYPNFYVRQLCPLVKRRLQGEKPIACMYCSFEKQCLEYIQSLRRNLRE